MDISQGIAAVNQGIVLVCKLSAPILLISMGVGLVIAVFQAATQIHEQTLTFVPKFIAIMAVLMLGGNWMLTSLTNFFHYLLSLMV